MLGDCACFLTTKQQNLDTRLDSFIAQSEQFVNNEMLDDHMGDSNFKKMLDIGGWMFAIWITIWCRPLVVTTGRRFKAAIVGEEESREDLRQYTVNSNPEEIEVWKEMEEKCQEVRLTDPEAMDIYDINPGQAAVTRSTLQLNLLQDEDEYGTGKGETTWLALGLKLEEAQ